MKEELKWFFLKKQRIVDKWEYPRIQTTARVASRRRSGIVNNAVETRPFSDPEGTGTSSLTSL